MQEILIPLRLDGVLATPVDTYGQPWASRQTITRGMQAVLKLMLFKDGTERYTAADLAFASWDFVVAHDWDTTTAPQLRVIDGIFVDEDDLVNIPLLEINTVELLEKLGTSESITLGCELCGFAEGETKPDFVCQFNLSIRNRRSDAGTGTPTTVPDGHYNSAQVDALLAAKADSDDIIIYAEGTGIDITDGTIGIDVTGATTGQVLKKTELGVGWEDETVGLPEIVEGDNDKVLTVVNGAWAKADLPEETIELPVVTVADNDKILTVVAGAWSAGTAPVGVTTASVQTALSIDTVDGLETKVLSEKGTFVDLPEAGTGEGTTYTAGDGIAIANEVISLDVTGATTGQVLKKTELGIGWANDETGTAELPTVTAEDNDKILTVVNGAWASGTAPVSATTTNVQAALSINTSTGSLVKVLSEKGIFVDLPEAGTGEGATYTAGDGIDITNDAISIASSSATTGQILSKGETGVAWVAAPVSATTANVQSALSIDTGAGSETKVLSEKGTFVDLPEGGSTGGLTADDALMMILAFS